MQDIYDLIIIGGGPAGITAGIYAARARLKTILITKNFGGQIARKTVMIENYPGFDEISGQDLIQRFVNHLKKQEIEILNDEIRKVEKEGDIFKVEVKTKKIFQSLAIIVSSGADPRLLDVPGENEFIGRGVSYCTACDGPIFKEKIVAVIGGGNSGFEAAIFLANYAKKIYILEYSNLIKADARNQEMAKNTGKVEVITNAVLKRIEGKNFVEAIIFEDKKEKKEKKLEVQGVFIEVGSQPATAFVKHLVNFNVAPGKRDEIEINPWTCETQTPGLFAAGDATNIKYKQIVIACGEGAKAALSAYEYIRSLKNIKC